ncbi:hypothetical protein [Mycolicibacterium arenosum]|uniref:TrbL/VirB6 plasmid conjugal transfer protein n=1 Tax=Mycolicibacterium arenosum TaxID=2952157 RepID=A0ABT1MCD6_9MYCO|nr:hypothetical protein [Mycolicibacterium sp. CAU 1645]MCP9276834.1 hypothetical protein [Mycolicibacterium sp. CAU 1645]
MTDAVAAWLYTRPRTRRCWRLLRMIWGAAVLAVVTAPRAVAETTATGLSFTGLHDSRGVPIGAMFVSVLPLDEVLGAQGPRFGVDPDTWLPALTSAMQTTLTYTQLAGWLGLECAFFLCMCAVGIWLIKFALGAVWLGWLAAIAQPIVANLQAVVGGMQLLAGGVLISVLVGGILCFTVGYGTGIGVIAGGLLIALLVGLVLRDPVDELVGDDGVLGIGRTLGFTLSQGVAHNGPLAPGGTAAQLDTLTSWLCDVLVRNVVQLVSFGQVIDDVPGCAARFDAAVLSGVTAAPAQAMRTCAPAAYAHAQQLSAVTVGLFAVVIALTGAILLAVDYIACEAFRIGFTAFWTVLIIVPVAAVAVIPGPTRAFGKRTAVRMLKHGAEMIAATAGLAVLVILMAQATRGTLPGAIGMTHPLAKLLVMLLIAVFGAIGFRHLMRAFGDRGIPGPLRMGAGGLALGFRAGRTLEGVDYTRRRLGDVRSRLSGGTQPGGSPRLDDGTAGRAAPGRRAHPPTGNRSPSGAAGTRPGGPTAPGTGNVPGRGRTPNTPVPQAKPPAGAAAGRTTAGADGAGGRAAATSGAARAGATVLAPEVAIPVAAAAAAAGRTSGRSGHRESGAAPGRAGSPAPSPAAPTPNRPDPQPKPPDTPADAVTTPVPPAPSSAPGRTPPRPTDP